MSKKKNPIKQSYGLDYLCSFDAVVMGFYMRRWTLQSCRLRLGSDLNENCSLLWFYFLALFFGSHSYNNIVLTKVTDENVDHGNIAKNKSKRTSHNSRRTVRWVVSKLRGFPGLFGKGVPTVE